MPTKRELEAERDQRVKDAIIKLLRAAILRHPKHADEYRKALARNEARP